MNVIGDAARPETFAIRIPGHRRQIGMEFWARHRIYERAALLRAKDQVEDNER